MVYSAPLRIRLVHDKLYVSVVCEILEIQAERPRVEDVAPQFATLVFLIIWTFRTPKWADPPHNMLTESYPH